MIQNIVHNASGATLIAAGQLTSAQITFALARAPLLVAADGGASTALEMARMPDLVIGDMDSIGAMAARLPAERLIASDDQDSTDFEKCLAHLDLPFLIALGVMGTRIDHSLAAMNAIVRHRNYPVLVLAGDDVIAACPPRLGIDLPVGTRVSLFPMAAVGGTSSGLAWPLQDLAFAPNGQIGTSNRSTMPRVALEFDAPGMLIILPAAHTDALAAALGISNSVR